VSAAAARQDLLVTPLDSLVAVLRTDRLLSGWPFQPRGASRVPVVDTLRPRTAATQLAQAVVLGNLPWPEAMERLRADYERTGSHDQALRVARAMAQEYSYSPAPLMDAARIALGLQRYDEGLRYVRAAHERQESRQSATLLGLLLLRHGDQAGALRQLRRASQLAPRDERLRLTVAAAEALPGLERERPRQPRNPDLLYNLAAAYALTQQYEKAREVLAALERVQPTHAAGRELRRKLTAPSP